MPRAAIQSFRSKRPVLDDWYEFWQTPLGPVARSRRSERVGSDVGSNTAY
jgi:hypothetical protein